MESWRPSGSPVVKPAQEEKVVSFTSLSCHIDPIMEDIDLFWKLFGEN